MPSYPKLAEGLIRSEDLLIELNDDVIAAYETLEKDRASQYLRRCLVRAVFAYMEAVIEIVKIELRSNIRTDVCTPNLTAKEEKLLGSLSIFRNSDKRIGLAENLKGTFKLAAKVWELSEYKLSTEGINYIDFRKAKHARDKLTHPKTFYDIQITDDDMAYCTAAGLWVRDSFETLFKMRVAQLKAAVGVEVGKPSDKRTAT